MLASTRRPGNGLAHGETVLTTDAIRQHRLRDTIVYEVAKLFPTSEQQDKLQEDSW